MEFATIFVGVLAVEVFGLTFGQAVAAILLGNVLAGAAHGVLSARGPLAGVPQMVLGRLAFGYRGNILPAGLMTITSGFGWFAVNSVSASFALSSLTGASPVAVAGDRRARAGRDRLPRAQPGARVRAVDVPGADSGVPRRRRWSCWRTPTPAFVPAGGGTGGLGGFLLTVGAVFGYTAGWTPYAADYTRYLPETVSRWATGLAAGVGNGLACTVLMIVGAASVSASAGAGSRRTTRPRPTSACCPAGWRRSR